MKIKFLVTISELFTKKASVTVDQALEACCDELTDAIEETENAVSDYTEDGYKFRVQPNLTAAREAYARGFAYCLQSEWKRAGTEESCISIIVVAVYL